MDVCREVVPPEVRFSDGVRVACHLYPTPDSTPTLDASATLDAAPAASPEPGT